MRAVVQRVTSASVTVDGEVIGAIKAGLAVLLGAEEGDTDSDLKYTHDKILNLRIFPDQDDKMNLSLLDMGGELLVVSQFTLLGDSRKGRRPSFVKAMEPQGAEAMIDRFVALARGRGVTVATGKFRAHMIVNFENDGPVTLLIDSQKRF
jgi:D-aminoacyl-tRNA deacylase